MASAETILATYLHVQNGNRLDPISVSETFWSELAEGNHTELDRGQLMSAFTFDEPWASWERHPAGEELVMLLSGAAEVVLELPGGENVVALSAVGDYVLVPPNIWHTARTSVPTTMLFLTPGAGTEHRPVGA
ncbi:MAG TPA: cupin domain-containing protein [Lysobacter sp.]|nr:cupin domain-containing protein [Lysobacter sp.]